MAIRYTLPKQLACSGKANTTNLETKVNSNSTQIQDIIPSLDFESDTFKDQASQIQDLTSKLEKRHDELHHRLPLLLPKVVCNVHVALSNLTQHLFCIDIWCTRSPEYEAPVFNAQTHNPGRK